jgi:outer membrane PBP1 activator LpoA protein
MKKVILFVLTALVLSGCATKTPHYSSKVLRESTDPALWSSYFSPKESSQSKLDSGEKQVASNKQ